MAETAPQLHQTPVAEERVEIVQVAPTEATPNPVVTEIATIEVAPEEEIEEELIIEDFTIDGICGVY